MTKKKQPTTQVQMLPMSAVEVNAGQLEGLPANPREIRDEKFEKLKQNIQKYPELLEYRSLMVYPMPNGKHIIIGGNMRYRAMQELGYTEVPCVIIPAETPVEKLGAYTILDNNGFGKWDWDLIANNWTDWDVEDLGLDWEFAGFDEEEANKENHNQAEEDDFDEEKEQIPSRVSLGDVWLLGEHRLMCGDSTVITDVEKLMQGEKADMVLSDPPYGMHLDTDFSGCIGSIGSIGRKNSTRGNKYKSVIGDNDDFSPDLITTFFNNFDYVKEMFLFGADYFAELLPNKNNGSWLVWDKRKESQADAIGSEFELIWSKNKHKRRMLRFDWFGFLSSKDAKDARNRVHPTQKPVSLLAEIIKQWGNNLQIIVDLFGGSGSTLIACEQLNRKCCMMELDPHYCDVIIARWEKLTGKQAVKLQE